MFLKRKDIDATQGPILKNFIVYAIPLAIGSIIQTLFNAADMMVLGNFASSVAVASVGATGTITSLLVNTFIGLSGGTQVVLAQAFGERNKTRIQKTVTTSLLIAVILGALITVVGLLCSGWFLTATKCPSDCIDGAALYMRIYFLSVPAILIYNYGSAIIRVSGDTQRPLMYLIAAGLLNVVLNFILCLLMKEKVAAVAIATVASQVLGAFLVIYRLLKIDNDCRFEPKTMSFDLTVFKKIMMIGIPCALNTSLYCISNLQIQSAINSFGSSATAANTAAASLEGWAGSFTNAAASTCLTFVGQNIGARKPERIKRTFFISLVMGFSLGLVLGLGLYSIGSPLLRLYVAGDDLAIQYGLIRMKFILAFYFIAGINGALGNTLQAFGYSLFTMLNSVFSVLVLRFFWMLFIYPHYETLTCLYFCYTVSWSLILIINLAMFFIIFKRKLRELRAENNTIATLSKQ
ncbi:MAG: MATE family efflux transporter [Clostridia bacterium]|nr:MATE family efflux transporter [Clostridia bacterium]